MSNMEWMALYHEVTIFVLVARALDHKPLYCTLPKMQMRGKNIIEASNLKPSGS
jgi:hypothetical protein